MQLDIIGIKYATSSREGSRTTYSIEASAINVAEVIKTAFGKEKINYLLVPVDGKLFIIEPLDDTGKEYSKREISYHPLVNKKEV